MEFFSINFFIFLITVLLLINSVRKAYHQQAILIVGSYIFYWTTSNFFILLLLFISVISFQFGEAIHSISDVKKRKITLIIALIFLLIPLGFFKYYNFGLNILNQIPFPLNYYLNLPFLDLIVPVGISFFTFTAISYVIDIYNQKIPPEKHFFRYTLLVSYFPHLLAGPIVRASQFLPQLNNRVSLCPESLKKGTTLILWGFVKKFIIADNCAPIVNAIFSHPTDYNSPIIIIGTILFAIQIYCDFSGYVDIALGIAELIGLHLPQNFLRPYLSKNPSEFWRRWNITLSSFIRDYVYIPLGGNRKGKLRTYFNLEFSMLICGLWHGAAWNFILWGCYHGVLLAIHRIISPRTCIFSHWFPSLKGNFQIVMSILITQYFIFLGWIMFRVGNLSDLIYCVKKYVLIDFNFSQHSIGISYFDNLMTACINLDYIFKIALIIATIIALLVLMRSDNGMNIVKYLLTNDWTNTISSFRLRYWIIYISIMTLILLCLTPSASPVFIYFQF